MNNQEKQIRKWERRVGDEKILDKIDNMSGLRT
jgi:hypothetical protein